MEKKYIKNIIWIDFYLIIQEKLRISIKYWFFDKNLLIEFMEINNISIQAVDCVIFQIFSIRKLSEWRS